MNRPLLYVTIVTETTSLRDMYARASSTLFRFHIAFDSEHLHCYLPRGLKSRPRASPAIPL